MNNSKKWDLIVGIILLINFCAFLFVSAQWIFNQ